MLGGEVPGLLLLAHVPAHGVDLVLEELVPVEPAAPADGAAEAGALLSRTLVRPPAHPLQGAR